MKGTKDFFNKTVSDWSKEWLSDREKSGICKTFYDLYAKVGNNNPKILDAGSGSGYDSYLLSNLGAKVVGIDFAENLVEISKENVPNCDFFIRDITENLDDLGLFDGVFCTAVIDYIDILKLRQTFLNFSNIMKQGALLFISVLDGNGKNELKSIFRIENEDYDLCFYNYNAEQICTFAYPEFKLVDTFKFDDFSKGWHYYVFMKK